MGASVCATANPNPTACDVAAAACQPRRPMRCYHNAPATGQGGAVRKAAGHTVCLVAAFDYEGYSAEERSGCGPLRCAVADGRRFADLAGASMAEVIEFYDTPGIPGSLGFPSKPRILSELCCLGKNLGPEDVLVFFFAGHSAQVPRSSRAGTSTGPPEDALCFVREDGTSDLLSEGEVFELLCRNFDPQTRIVFVTECCHGSGATIDLSRSELAQRPICQISGVLDSQSCLNCEGAFASSLFDVIHAFARYPNNPFSVVDVFNECYERIENWQDGGHDLRFERTEGFDPDTFAWPLVPPRGWQAPKTPEMTMVQQRIRPSRLNRRTNPWHTPDRLQPWSWQDATSWTATQEPRAFRRSLDGGA
eukprot:TRINITY_DN41813_c0_g1_i1.p1 TRINITY_DN41813_c0_g1~~TRINITY_DN41813_c0_g1_i1.p1  ORF type:complete len:364 (+),score=46.99 TRINITY_DN41813_c0_g1_i1:81-1172(+)